MGTMPQLTTTLALQRLIFKPLLLQAFNHFPNLFMTPQLSHSKLIRQHRATHSSQPLLPIQ